MPRANPVAARTPPPCAAKPRPARGLPYPAVLVALVLVAVAVAYADALHAWFAADDFLWLSLSSPESVLASFKGSWGHGPAYRPLARVSFYLDWLLFGFAAGGWHAHNLLLHVVAATLLGWLVARLSSDRVFATASALIFALLPLGYENTIWISGRGYSLTLALSLGALILFDRYLLRPSARRLLGAALVYAAALLAYEASVVVAGFAACWCCCAGGRCRAGARPWRGSRPSPSPARATWRSWARRRSIPSARPPRSPTPPSSTSSPPGPRSRSGSSSRRRSSSSPARSWRSRSRPRGPARRCSARLRR